MKVCTKCKLEKDFLEFSKNKSKKDGHNHICKLCDNEKKKKYYELNKDNRKKYFYINKEKRAEYHKEYYKKNKEKIITYTIEYTKNRINNDSLFKLRTNIKTLIYSKFKNNGYTKNSKTNNILGCTFQEFKIHLENQFTEGMNWSNQGLWHLDHIKPISLATTEEEVIALNHYTNFQPLWAEDNLRKGNKYEEIR
jgi:hypothetical protein